MGERLAKEVNSFIEEWCPNGTLKKLSFIGHSLGGLIIRAALPHLEHLKDKLYSYISLSSPHLGCAYDSSLMVDTGISVM